MASNPIVNMFKVKEIRNRLFITLLVLAVFRLGSVITVPGIDATGIFKYFDDLQNQNNNAFASYMDFFVGGAFSNFSIFLLGVMPYISMQIIMQLAVIIFPSLKRISQEDGGQRKIAQYSRIGTIVVCLIQAWGMTVYAYSIPAEYHVVVIQNKILFRILFMLTVTTGSMATVWLGDQITARGIGNGISLMIFAGIVARMPSAFGTLISSISTGTLNPVALILVVIMFVFVVIMVVYEEQGQRKIPVNYAKRVVGRKMYGAGSSYIPFKINPSGVIPVIFASALLTFPLQIASSLGNNVRWLQSVANFLNPQGAPYLIIYTLLIIGFAFFYTQISLNPVEMAKNIRDNGGSIPGVKNENMEKYLTKVLNRIVLPGAIFLAFIALIPTLIQKLFSFPASVAMLFGGTSLIIMVGVCLDTVRQLDGLMKMHHHDGFVGSGRKTKKI